MNPTSSYSPHIYIILTMMVIRVNQKDFAIAIQKMGHIQYLLQYKNLPFLYRQGD